ncbi:MAG TPA: serine protease [Stellaceae bacterium]|nr:serine protease [Stellaceae bacterium]
MDRLAVFILMVVAAMTIGPSLAAAAMIPRSQFSFNKWNGAGYTDDKSGGFSHCVVQSSYTDGTTLLLAVNPNFSVTIGFSRPSSTFTVGQEIAGDITIDQRYAVHVVGIAYLPTAVKVTFAPGDPIFGHLQHGYVMTVSLSAEAMSYNLTDTFSALEMARRCAATYQARLGTDAQDNPELQNWLARNPWFSDPYYADQARTAADIDSKMRLEGKDRAAAAYYAELDERIRKAGLVLPSPRPATHPPPTTRPAVAVSPLPPAPPPLSQKTVDSSGTGFVVSPAGHIVTNNHVISACVGDVHGDLPGESEMKLRIVATDAADDLALLIAPGRLNDAVALRGAAIHPGDGIIAIGYALYGILTTDYTVMTGTVGSLDGIGNDSRYMQISAPVQPGNSGGPLLDTSGNLAGVISEKLDAIKIAEITASVPEDINFALKTRVLKDFLDKNAVSYSTALVASEVKTADIAARARSYTMRVWCTARAEE